MSAYEYTRTVAQAAYDMQGLRRSGAACARRALARLTMALSDLDDGKKLTRKQLLRIRNAVLGAKGNLRALRWEIRNLQTGEGIDHRTHVVFAVVDEPRANATGGQA